MRSVSSDEMIPLSSLFTWEVLVEMKWFHITV